MKSEHCIQTAYKERKTINHILNNTQTRENNSTLITKLRCQIYFPLQALQLWTQLESNQTLKSPPWKIAQVLKSKVHVFCNALLGERGLIQTVMLSAKYLSHTQHSGFHLRVEKPRPKQSLRPHKNKTRQQKQQQHAQITINIHALHSNQNGVFRLDFRRSLKFGLCSSPKIERDKPSAGFFSEQQ